ncbi:hypothetical protein PCE1_000379 [Barthelona sp. PCE]
MSGGGKNKSGGYNSDKRDRAPGFTPSDYAKMKQELPKRTVITPAVVAESYRVTVTIARKVLKELHLAGSIRQVSKNIYSRKIAETE